ncbi:unnamed protein product, partial [Iphiclides podalirius]
MSSYSKRIACDRVQNRVSFKLREARESSRPDPGNLGVGTPTVKRQVVAARVEPLNMYLSGREPHHSYLYPSPRQLLLRDIFQVASAPESVGSISTTG